MEPAPSSRPQIRVTLPPEVMKSIEVLQLATLDLKDLIVREMAMNPTIDVENAEPAVGERAGPTPDVVVERLNGDWVVRVAPLPRFRARPTGWLAESIEYRNEILLSVTRAIVRLETDFLQRGPEAIRKLRLQDVADRAGIHVSIFARALHNKWLRTPHGVFPLRHFFLTQEEWQARNAHDRRRKRARRLFLVGALVGICYLVSVWRLAEARAQRPVALDALAVAAGALVGVGATIARRRDR